MARWQWWVGRDFVSLQQGPDTACPYAAYQVLQLLDAGSVDINAPGTGAMPAFAHSGVVKRRVTVFFCMPGLHTVFRRHDASLRRSSVGG